MRADRPKQYLDLAGSPVLHHTLARLAAHSRIDGIYLGLRKGDAWWCSNPWVHPKLMHTGVGGDERIHTVVNLLNDLLEREGDVQDWVLVHDAVRPCIQSSDIDSLIDIVSDGKAGGLLALPLTDTLKKDNGSGYVETTVGRDQFWRAMTPQMFQAGPLLDALRHSLDEGFLATDESAAMERIGISPRLVACNPGNIKITTSDDLALAQQLLAVFS